MYTIYDLIFYEECLEKEMAAKKVSHSCVEFIVTELLKIQKYADELARKLDEFDWEEE